MSDSNQTLLFIPDISGFTNFVNKTEINHSRHIISELLELIIESDKINMNISEIEGDAILFFKEEVPALSELIEQCQTTFFNFHNHLLRYNSERICRCGACETAAQLSLKFIIHKGDVEQINVRKFKKLYGSDVIFAHKLLKNSIPSDEYILISDRFKIDKDINDKLKVDELTIEKGSDNYEDLGKFDYLYISFKKLLSKLTEQSKISFPKLDSEEINVEKIINAPFDQVYDIMTNLDIRRDWNKDVKEVTLLSDKLNSSGSVHNCIVGSNSLDIESLGRIENDEQILYGERLNAFKDLRDIIFLYKFAKKGQGTLVSVKIGFKIKSRLGKLMKPLIRNRLKKQNEDVLERLRIVSEKVAT